MEREGKLKDPSERRKNSQSFESSENTNRKKKEERIPNNKNVCINNE